MANNDSSGANEPEIRFRKRAERRPEMVKQRRERRRQEFERQKRNWLIVRVVSAVIVVAILLGAGWWGFRQYEEYQVRDDVTTYFSIEDYAANHIEGELLYAHVPPVGGPHNNAWQNCGYYSEPVYNRHGVHSMEHGSVWVTYDPDLPDADIQKLEDLANQSYVLVSPYPGLEHPVVASVWGKQIELNGVDDDRLEPFIREYRLNPDNTPERGAVCSRGVDFTMEEGETPQQAPAIISGPPEAVATAEAEATAAAGGTPEGEGAATPSGASTPAPAAATPATSPVASPAATPAASPAATPAGDDEG